MYNFLLKSKHSLISSSTEIQNKEFSLKRTLCILFSDLNCFEYFTQKTGIYRHRTIEMLFGTLFFAMQSAGSTG